jgi:phosphatidylserine/phosphatidylglycerophosphate/cardiolipin synthase-like enzyme
MRKVARSTNRGLTVTAHAGDGAVLLAFDLPLASIQGGEFAGFAIRCTPPAGSAFYLPNRLSFAQQVTRNTTPAQRVWTPSDQAPFQKFHWVHFVGDVQPGTYRYDVSARFFVNGALVDGPSGSATVGFAAAQGQPFELGFTSGNLTSQAYAERFQNRDIRPAGPRTLLFDTQPFAQQYDWLGGHARRMILGVLDECVTDPSLTVDLFAFDLDEPDIVRKLVQLGSRLRAFLDDSASHTGTSLEVEAHRLLVASAGAANVVQGSFTRFAHDKVILVRRGGQPIRVITGSANFSLRGLYVQANNVIRFNHAGIAALYGRVFDQVFRTAGAGFPATDLAARWFDFPATPGVPDCAVSFAPHATAGISLDRVQQALQAASSSVLFAVMDLAGSGPVIQTLKNLHAQGRVLSYGVTQTTTGIGVYKPGEPGVLVPFAALDKNVPPPFVKEWRGGMGEVIHDKFIVIDFNSDHPVVITGSSNLAAGGETNNGDNLLMIMDPDVAAAFAVEAIRLVDHFQFRAAMENATTVRPLTLQRGTALPRWWTSSYDPNDVHSRIRTVLSGVPPARARRAARAAA